MLKPENKIQVKMGRPPKYKPEMVQKAEEYLKWCIESDETPFIEELALRLGVWDDTLREWEQHEDKEDFKVVMKKLRNVQKLDLKKKSLKGKYVSKIVTLLLTAEHNIIPVFRKEVSGIGGNPIELESKLSPEQEKDMSDKIAKIFEDIMR